MKGRNNKGRKERESGGEGSGGEGTETGKGKEGEGKGKVKGLQPPPKFGTLSSPLRKCGGICFSGSQFRFHFTDAATAVECISLAQRTRRSTPFLI
jgi:hypothetical protein